MGKIQVMHRRQRLAVITHTRRMDAIAISEICRAPWLIQRSPCIDAIAESLGQSMYVIAVPQCRIAIRPASLVFQVLRQIPVI